MSFDETTCSSAILFDTMNNISGNRNAALEAFRAKDWGNGALYALRIINSSTDPEIHFYLGCCYEKGFVVEQDDVNAANLYAQAVEKGHVKAMCRLAGLRERSGTDKELVEAVKLYANAAVKGDAASKKRLGELGNDIATAPIVIDQALYAFKKGEYKKGGMLALLTDMSDRTLQMWVGYCYDEGKGTKKDDVKALHWYQMAADNGNAWSMYRIGWKYEFGEGVEADLVKAFRWYKKAATEGEVEGQYNLADMYEDGKGTKKDLDEALYWYRLAAGQGHAKAKRGVERIEAELGVSNTDDPIKQLDRMIGLQSVKDKVRELVDLVKVQRMREADWL